MDADLHPLVVALADLNESELRALVEAARKAPHTVPGLLAWIEHAADWEQNRRRGLDFPLQLPEAAIPPEEDTVSIRAASAMRDEFAADSARVAAMFYALLDVLTRVGQRH